MREKLSIITTLYNRAHLLKWGLAGVYNQTVGHEVELNIGDDGSTDDLDELLLNVSRWFGWKVNKYDTSVLANTFNRRFNCPATHYNALVSVSDSEFIIKIDPEFVMLTPGFIDEALTFLRSDEFAPYFIMPLPYHAYEFAFNSMSDIKDNFKSYVYETHIRPETAHSNNVYYGSIFNKKAYIKLGGIDVRFLDGIGSEDDHFLDQWRKCYGAEYVKSLVNHHGVHLWHGEWGKGVPSELNKWVNQNANLRTALSNVYPNDGNFLKINYPRLSYTTWKNGELIGAGETDPNEEARR